MKKFSRLHKLTRYSTRGGKKDLLAEITRRAEGMTLRFEPGFVGASNPLNSWDALEFVHRRYRAALDYIDRNPVRNLLEIGCGHGLAAWVLSDAADRVVALDVDKGRVAVGRHLFPEIEFVCEDYEAYLRRPDTEKFDIIIASFVPLRDLAPLRSGFDKLIQIGFAPTSWRDVLTWRYKAVGRHLSFSTTIIGDGMKGIDPRYPLYYFDKTYYAELRRSLRRSGLPIW